MTKPASFAADRTLSVPPGAVVKTGYVDIWKIRLACRDRMSVGDVGEAYQKVLQLGPNCCFPCPNGRWDGDEFVILDGRHEFIASVMLGKTHMLVAWIEPAD